MWCELSDRYIESPLVAQCIVVIIFSVGQNKSDKHVTYLLAQMTFSGDNSYLGHTPKYSEYPQWCGDWQSHILLQTLDSSSLRRRADAQPT